MPSVLAPDAPPMTPGAKACWEVECAGKGAYTSQATAEAVLAYFKRQGTLRGACWMGIYECRFCGSWHMGRARRGR